MPVTIIGSGPAPVVISTEDVQAAAVKASTRRKDVRPAAGAQKDKSASRNEEKDPDNPLVGQRMDIDA